MNPDQTAKRICRLLDTGADNLPTDIQARLSQARGVALSRLDTRQRHPARHAGWRQTLHEGFWAGLPAWARVGAATAPVLLAALLVLPNPGQAPDPPPQSTVQTTAQAPAPESAAQRPGSAPSPVAILPAEAPPAVAAADPALSSPEPLETEAPAIGYHPAFTPAPGISIPVGMAGGSRFAAGYGGFTRVSTASPVSFTMPITPNPAPPLSSFDPYPYWGAGR